MISYYFNVSFCGTHMFRTESTDDHMRYLATKDALVSKFKNAEQWQVTEMTVETKIQSFSLRS